MEVGSKKKEVCSNQLAVGRVGSFQEVVLKMHGFIFNQLFDHITFFLVRSGFGKKCRIIIHFQKIS